MDNFLIQTALVYESVAYNCLVYVAYNCIL